MFNDQRTHHSHDFRPERFCMGRHHGGQGFGHFAGGFFGGFGRGGFRSGRKFAAADLHLIILALLEEKPRHGYELIKALEERSGGFYAPSPGMIYPALTYLEEIGHATFEADGTKKLYSITEAGRRHLEENRSAVETMFGELEHIGSRMDDVRRAFSGEGRRDEDDDQGPRGSKEFHAARQELKSVVRAKHGCSAEEARRIAGILRRAAAEIAGKL
jgi:DNA-binding PadR family transcriptional regulator